MLFKSNEIVQKICPQVANNRTKKMKTSVWGPSAWRFLHAISFAFPDKPSLEDREAAKSLLQSLTRLLPCEDCKTHFAKNLANTNLDAVVQSKASFASWLVDFHNAVNMRLGKSNVDFETVAHEFEDVCTNSCHDPSPQTCTTSSSRFLVMTFVCVCVLAFAFWKRR